MPVPQAALMLQVVLIAIFVPLEFAYVLGELQHRVALRKFARVVEVTTSQQFYSFLGKFTSNQFVALILGVLNQICSLRQRGRGIFIVDSTEIQMDLNWFRKKWPKAALGNRDFQWGYSPSKVY